MKQENKKYCTECGAQINIKAEICPKCGVRQTLQSAPIGAEITEQRNNWITSNPIISLFGNFSTNWC
tara:strand:- start:241 stop:441 length:201 start_codon:yes stop_codon:yes gene_type:complete